MGLAEGVAVLHAEEVVHYTPACVGRCVCVCVCVYVCVCVMRKRRGGKRMGFVVGELMEIWVRESRLCVCMCVCV